ncbi:MAG: fumarate reductase/succinate dehydrogenase flavoprotein subunit, partial [Flavobacteriaceae bacterium]|nr:fumarate reductase/succinate dehydrogenase flavoprotein subunit [Flavobacteriaceae bacterium]
SIPKVDDNDIRKIIQGATSILLRENGNNPYLIHEELQKNMQYNVGIIRTKNEIENGIKEIDVLKSKFKDVKAPGSSQFNPGWHEALALRNLLISAESVAKSALIREESRGAHTREDFPSEREEWIKYNIINKKGKDGKMETVKILRTNPDKELKRIAYSKLNELEKEVKIDHDKLKVS